jgi:hypothetical protein
VHLSVTVHSAGTARQFKLSRALWIGDANKVVADNPRIWEQTAMVREIKMLTTTHKRKMDMVLKNGVVLMTECVLL